MLCCCGATVACMYTLVMEIDVILYFGSNNVYGAHDSN